MKIGRVVLLVRPTIPLVPLAVLVGVAGCDPGPKPSPTATGPIALPGERPANPSLATPPDEWAAPPRQTAQARTVSQ